MIMGGVPFYWSQLQAGKSLLQNINLLFFSEDGVLRHEFADLYDSLFKKSKPYLMIINALATKKVGMTRTEILKATKMSDNGKLTEFLENLEYCGFIRKYITSGIDNNLQNKRERFIQETRTRKAVHLTMITTMGLMQNSYAWDIQSVVTMDDLFI